MYFFSPEWHQKFQLFLECQKEVKKKFYVFFIFFFFFLQNLLNDDDDGTYDNDQLQI